MRGGINEKRQRIKRSEAEIEAGVSHSVTL